MDLTGEALERVHLHGMLTRVAEAISDVVALIKALIAAADMARQPRAIPPHHWPKQIGRALRGLIQDCTSSDP